MIGVARAPEFSPGVHADNDRGILEATAATLEALGWRVALRPESAIDAEALDTDIVFTMGQSDRTNAVLAAHASRGALVINHPRAVGRCCRAALYAHLAGDPLLPPAHTIDTAAPPDFGVVAGPGGVWLKRAGAHAVAAGDVVHVEAASGYGRALAGMARRGIARAVAQRHVTGDTVKFYGVRGTGFFRGFDADGGLLSAAEAEALRAQVEPRAARVGLEIYGGDAVVAGARVWLIDLNDWPSFARVRAEAAAAIAGHIHQRGTDHVASRRA